MTTHLSVNLNRIALLRNSRDIGIPDVLKFARLAIAAGAHGVTVHPRPDQRHIRPSDVSNIKAMLGEHAEVEFNIEGNPFSGGAAAFMPLVEKARPQQATLVPDNPEQLTSDHGWNLARDGAALAPAIAQLKAWGCRVSLFMDPEPEAMEQAARLGADRVELYTKPYADAHAAGDAQATLGRYRAAITAARSADMGVNAGHDLNLDNLPALIALGGIDEVSIGHALIADALERGFVATVRAYLNALKPGE